VIPTLFSKNVGLRLKVPERLDIRWLELSDRYFESFHHRYFSVSTFISLR
jgi:hypothetical protein